LSAGNERLIEALRRDEWAERPVHGKYWRPNGARVNASGAIASPQPSSADLMLVLV
jgi:hypothetical protein